MAFKNLNPSLNIFIAIILMANTSPNILHRVKATDPANGLCRQTSHYDLCLSIVAADNRPRLKVTPNGVATILRDRALAISAATTDKITGLLKSATNKHEIESLKSCSEGYSKAISSLRSANFTVMNRETFPSLVAAVSGASKEGPSDCEGLFRQPPAVTFPSPLTADNQKLGEVCETTLDIIVIAAWGNNGCN